MSNPTDAHGQPICPVCFRSIAPGRSRLRGSDELLVHLECDDGVVAWRPRRWPLDNRADGSGRPLCPLCSEPVNADANAVREHGYLLHSGCWRTPERQSVRVHVDARDWDNRQWRFAFEADLIKTGWEIVAIEAPTPHRAEYVYIAVLDPKVVPV